MKDEMCRMVLETNLYGLVEYPWMATRNLAEGTLWLTLKMLESKPHILVIKSYVECAVSYIV